MRVRATHYPMDKIAQGANLCRKRQPHKKAPSQAAWWKLYSTTPSGFCQRAHGLPDSSNGGVLGGEIDSVKLRPVDKTSIPTIGDLYPHLSGKELAQAEDNLERYLTLVLRIFERIESETGPQPDPLAPAAGTLLSPLPGSKSSE